MGRGGGWTAGFAVGAVVALAAVVMPGASRAVSGGAAGIARGAAGGAAAGAVQAPTAPAFLQAMRGTPPVACELALRALGNRWGSSSVIPTVHPPLAPSAEERALARWAWTDRPLAADVDVLIGALSDPDPCARRIAAALLGEMDDPGVTSRLERLAEEASGQERLAAILALGHGDDDTGDSPVLERILAGGDAESRRAAAWALGGRGAGIDPLSRALGDADPMLRENAAWALGRTENRAALAPLIGALDDGTTSVRVNAAWALGELEDADAIDALAALLAGDGDAEVRRAAAFALGRIER